MGSNQNINSGCLFPFGDDFLPIFMFFFHLNKSDPGALGFDEEDEEDEEIEDTQEDDDMESDDNEIEG